LFFYLIAVALLGFRVYAIVFIIGDETIVLTFLPICLKLVVGYTQTWAIIELIIRVRQCMYALDKIHHPQPLLDSRSRRLTVRHLEEFNNKREIGIQLFRVANIVVILIVIGITVYTLEGNQASVQDYRIPLQQSIERLCTIFVIVFIVAIFLTLFSFGVLLRSTYEKEKAMSTLLGGGSAVYTNERRRLILILVVFTASYTLDCLYFSFGVSKFAEDNCYWLELHDLLPTCKYFSFVIWQELYYIFDLVPIMMILVVHQRNFRLNLQEIQELAEKEEEEKSDNLSGTHSVPISRLVEIRSIQSQEDIIVRRVMLNFMKSSNRVADYNNDFGSGMDTMSEGFLNLRKNSTTDG